MWRLLRDRQLAGLKFRRQVPIGPFIADFACIEMRLVVELDGDQHAESCADAMRDALLRRHGWRVLRIWNADVRESPAGVLSQIAAAAGVAWAPF